MEKEKYPNLEVEEYKVSKDDFVFVQQDTKIHDKKLETKPTTFIKDAFRRFCKNKSSVVGAIILGIIIVMAIIVPIISPKNITRASLGESNLAPKLFEKGTGFWDGTIKHKNIIYDFENEVPAGYLKRAIQKGTLQIDEEPSYVNAVSKYGKEGYFTFVNEYENVDIDEEGYDYTQYVKYLNNYNNTTFDSTKTNFVDIIFYHEDDERYPGTVEGEYQVSILYNYVVGTDGTSTYDELVLVPYTKATTDLNLNISQAIIDAGLEKLENAKFNIFLKAADSARASIMIKSIVFNTDDATTKAFLDGLSFTSGNEAALRAVKEGNIVPENYWRSDGIKAAFKTQIYYCSFIYDPYEAAYGLQEVTVDATTLMNYVEAGWCKYDYKVGPTSFEILDEENCPISSIVGQTLNSRTRKLLSVTATQYKYLQLGYTEAPKFLMGTDGQGRDLFKMTFNGLRISLLLGVITAAVCFTFGLVWGAISGYFGGNVDLAMERFCDILAGVPWIVIMTLCILHLGSNFGTFVLALCLTGWMGTAARTRTQFYRFKGREYVLASRTLGASDMRLIFRHILPNSLGTIVTGAVLMVPSVIFSEATISYLNLGLKNLNSFGIILSAYQQYLAVYPYLVIFPAVILSLMMISFNLFGNGLRDALNPSLKGGEM